jgi:hypothetical protein
MGSEPGSIPRPRHDRSPETASAFRDHAPARPMTLAFNLVRTAPSGWEFSSRRIRADSTRIEPLAGRSPWVGRFFPFEHNAIEDCQGSLARGNGLPHAATRRPNRGRHRVGLQRAASSAILKPRFAFRSGGRIADATLRDIAQGGRRRNAKGSRRARFHRFRSPVHRALPDGPSIAFGAWPPICRFCTDRSAGDGRGREDAITGCVTKQALSVGHVGDGRAERLSVRMEQCASHPYARREAARSSIGCDLDDACGVCRSVRSRVSGSAAVRNRSRPRMARG